MITPTEFALWLNGAADIMGDNPTPEQWEMIRSKLGETMGFLATKKLLQKAEEQLVREREEEQKKAEDMAMKEAMAKFAADHQRQVDVAVKRVRASPAYGYVDPHDRWAARAGLLLGTVNADKEEFK